MPIAFWVTVSVLLILSVLMKFRYDMGWLSAVSVFALLTGGAVFVFGVMNGWTIPTWFLIIIVGYAALLFWSLRKVAEARKVSNFNRRRMKILRSTDQEMLKKVIADTKTETEIRRAAIGNITDVPFLLGLIRANTEIPRAFGRLAALSEADEEDLIEAINAEPFRQSAIRSDDLKKAFGRIKSPNVLMRFNQDDDCELASAFLERAAQLVQEDPTLMTTLGVRARRIVQSGKHTGSTHQEEIRESIRIDDATRDEPPPIPGVPTEQRLYPANYDWTETETLYHQDGYRTVSRPEKIIHTDTREFSQFSAYFPDESELPDKSPSPRSE